MYIENLLEEQQSLKNKITKAMLDLKEWFLDKIENIKEYFNGLRDRFTTSKHSTKQDSTPITRDVIINDKVVFKKGTPSNKVWSKLSETIHSVKTETEKAIRQCKDGIRKVMNHDKEGALENKNRVIKHIKQISVMGSIILGGIGAILICQKRKKSSDEHDNIVYYDNEQDDNGLLGTSKRNLLMLGTSRKELPALDTTRRDHKRITTNGSVKLLTMSEPEDKVADIKKTVEEKIKNKTKKVDEVKKTVKKKVKENKATRKPKKSVLNKNPLKDIDNQDSSVEEIKRKISGLYKTVKRLENQHDRIEKEYAEELKEIMANHSGKEASKLIDDLDGQTKPRLNSCVDKLNVTYAEIDRLTDLLNNK